MLELTTLAFKVDTRELTEATTKTKELAQAQKALGAAMQKGSSGGSQQNANRQQKEQVGLLTKLDDLLKDLASGATRWEASQLRAARQMNIPLGEVKDKLSDIRKLMSDPFDSAIGSIRSITQQYEQLQNRVSLANEGILLTSKQLKEFSKIGNEIEARMKSGGKDPKGSDVAEFSAT
ncbi:MAG: hypothetical protein ACRDBG_18230, partial [Waterburya sp.]